MTAEVGVMNQNGVALAADSAVTVGQPNAEKIYTSVDKLFQLSHHAPVGIMVYGNASLLKVPWETTIKLYRKSLADKNRLFSRLEEYAQDFFRYLRTARRLFTAEDQSTFAKVVAVSFYREYVVRKLDAELRTSSSGKSDVSVKSAQEALSTVVERELERTKRQGLAYDSIPVDFEKRLLRQYRAIFLDSQKVAFEKLPLSKAHEEQLLRLICKLISGNVWNKGFTSGVVISGFGEDEHFPVTAHTTVAGYFCNHPLHEPIHLESIGRDNTAVVMPFAQSEMVLTFMHGVDPSLRRKIEATTSDLLKKIVAIIIDDAKKRNPSYGTGLDKRLSSAVSKLATDLFGEWATVRKREYVNSVMEMVAALPKDELAAMAESLVNLTKFKRRVSRQQETVGGPIDVAVITKGDGFIWVKRKHYFRPELNPRFMKRVGD